MFPLLEVVQACRSLLLPPILEGFHSFLGMPRDRFSPDLMGFSPI